MKSKDFAQILRQAAHLSGESSVRQGLNNLAEFFDAAGADGQQHPEAC